MIKPLDIPVLETERLILRGWKQEDIPTVREISTDEEAARYIGGASPDWQAFRTVCCFIGHWQLRSFGFFAVEEKSTGDCIGWCGCWRPEGWPDDEIGYGFIKRVWGNGYASEAAATSLKWAYEHAGWISAISLIDQDNKGSQGVARKLGASIEQSDVKVNDFVADIWRHLPPKEFLERFG